MLSYVCSICACFVVPVFFFFFFSFFWCLGRAAACDWGTPWTCIFTFFTLQDTITLTRRMHHYTQLYTVTIFYALLKEEIISFYISHRAHKFRRQ